MTPNAARELLDRLFSPVTVSDFAQNIIDCRPFVRLPRSESALREQFLGEDPMGAIFDAYDLIAKQVRPTSRAPRGPRPSFSNIQSREEFCAALRQCAEAGFTVQLPEAGSIFPQLAQLRTALAMWFGGRVTVHLFWSAPGCCNYNHFDIYDVLIIQICGRKQWRIAIDDGGLPNDWPAMPHCEPEPSDNIEVVDLEMGEILYVPRGQHHEVDSLEVPSLHISIVFRPLPARDAVVATLDHLAEQDPRWREAVPFAGEVPISEMQPRGPLLVQLAELLRELEKGVRLGWCDRCGVDAQSRARSGASPNFPSER